MATTVMNPTALPYEILQTAREVYAGKTGFTQEEMRTLFLEKIREYQLLTFEATKNAPVWLRIIGALATVGTGMQGLQDFPSRAKALEYWLSQLPPAKQKELLLELCRKPDFPMWKKPSKEQRDRLAALLNGFVIDGRVAPALQAFDSTYVGQVWAKAIERCASDPENAITLARTLLEATCKHILDKRGRAYDDRANLPTLYSLAARELGITPNLQAEPIFQRIFTGFQTVVEGLGALRNNLGDAHGRGSEYTAPAPRHAELAVNFAGAAALFLI